MASVKASPAANAKNFNPERNANTQANTANNLWGVSPQAKAGARRRLNNMQKKRGTQQ